MKLGKMGYNGEQDWFWAEVQDAAPLERLRVRHQSALDFLAWERGPLPDKILAELEKRRPELLEHALKIHGAGQCKALRVQLMTIDEYRAEE